MKKAPVLPIRLYGDPVLRQPAVAVRPPDPKLHELATALEATMHEAEGVGLAAPQVGISLQLAVIDLRKVEKRPSSLEIGGQPVEWQKHMPLFFCNPVLTLTRKREDADEGCLSFPGLSGAVRRSLRIQMDYLDLEGKKMTLAAGGLLARAIQHEVDHLQGVLFIDRMDPEIRKPLKPALDELLAKSKAGETRR
ncbi:MAG: peptide deformylase [Verrucomicrobia bacterium]|nr:peptide deformylase [bacterium]NDA09559.1 peptide deformylase [Verrucomicrobiota bacterium]NDA25712.1 peptide deformylase [Verrucomicrobiota bacterium]NDD56469.1 peptide deformylase [Verrucomicrobiota bacterium]NDD81370.1 peptide deformylase [Verrucomicrobiota bacterium]